MMYLALPHLQVQQANALSTQWMISLCPVMAAVLMSHALGRALKVQPSGVAIIHHDAYLRAESFGDDRHPHQFRASTYIDGDDYSSHSKDPTLSLQPTATMDLEWSLVLRFDEDLPERALRKVHTFLQRGRLAGGLIVDYRDPVLGYSLKGRSGGDRSNWGVIDRVVGGGHILADRSSLLTGKGPHTRIDRLLALAGNDPDPEASGAQPFSGWLTPAVLGYALTSSVESRANVRNDLPHAYCEPMVGLVEYIGLRTLQEHPDLNPEDLFWRYSWPHEAAFMLDQDVDLPELQSNPSQ
ncbi:MULTISPECIES: type I-F CRISPR-associated protein Csy2 [unclassified Thioalkalivibrio]|uniref:type I-F CRISPR-associated protein Csy2 n=1 Tax=unclassified Thioalkalivibrio TaxID=2621013 RepID=UPI000380EC17|nr:MULTISPECIES: type I-F CRISPR-associated protein Csy2 [unclassified Thioalkalivibrio]